MQEIINNVNKIIENIKAECDKCGRDFNDITIIAASKTRDIDTIKFMLNNTAIQICGENKVQEFNQKFNENDNINWHFIGQLQTNKVKYLIGKVNLIHSVDRLELAKKINDLSERSGIVTNVLIEVNMGNELSKGGVCPENLIEFIKSLECFNNIKILGIMSVLPNDNEEVIEPLYDQLHNLYVKLKDIQQANLDVKYLSCGMSGDYLLAIKHGSNMVRIGTGIFGPRNYNI